MSAPDPGRGTFERTIQPEPVHRSTQGKARKRALDILFESELRGVDPLTTLSDRTADADPPVRDYTVRLVEAVGANRNAIDARISAALARGWTLARLPRVDRAALRIAVCEVDFLDVAPGVAVSEAVSLVGELSTDDSPSFVNGVLGAVVRESSTA
ncbi:N utilization substance protein B [Friedmanniella endophytica]|uniref:Transcription antitermination protein NusB n=1 Tax=Microlunatus kandeliicorticis TaxID=1759536 RepID=A0A7W3ITS8_9ACTN|nr:transcription antitermination factor NusB [Microlunatus kandeliicorticis]MBA8795096.1 N utilization substance protein B [Microlunatus kandeliicorticis]